MSTSRILSTNRSFGVLMLRGVCSFAILTLVDLWNMQSDLNLILKPYTAKRSNFMFLGHKSKKLMNEELRRRGIDYKTNTLPWNMMKALNLLSEDYNRLGC